MRSLCLKDYDRELANPPDKPFKATPFTYINRTYRRLFATEEDRANEEQIRNTRQQMAALLREQDAEIAALAKRINQLEQVEVAPSKVTHRAALASCFKTK